MRHHAVKRGDPGKAMKQEPKAANKRTAYPETAGNEHADQSRGRRSLSAPHVPTL